MILVTGGAGFIGGNFVLDWLAAHDEPVLNVDALTYAGNPRTLASCRDDPRHVLVRADVTDAAAMAALLAQHRPRAIVHCAAETHVDNSIAGPRAFLRANVLGTFELLEASRAYWSGLPEAARQAFRFVHVSTDEVYGDLAHAPGDPDAPAPVDEAAPYRPNSPYSATKAASDHLVRAWHRTYGLPTLVSNCSNNYGPYQYPEKLIPLVIRRALLGEPLPLYGDGQQVRDWLYVRDHAAAIRRMLSAGRPGEVYNVGGRNEQSNLALVRRLCALLDARRPRADGRSYAEQIAFVADRPGHDRRYAVDAGKIERELGWRPGQPFDAGLALTVDWYLDNPAWVADAVAGARRRDGLRL